MSHDSTIAVVGATGAVGREALRILEAWGVVPSRVRALASSRSAGGTVPYAGGALVVGDAESFVWSGGAAILGADAATARRLAPRALAGGTTVVDNSSAFRLDPAVPLVVPEVNADLLLTSPQLIANPNCSTILLVVALEPLRRRFGVRAVDVATYQAVSGAGLAGIDALLHETRSFAAGAPPVRSSASPFAEPCAGNVFSHDSPVDPESGVNGEERKMIDESRRIWDDPSLRITPTCIRVPVLRAHTQAVTVELREPASEAQVREALAGADGIELVDDRAGNRFPTPLDASGRDHVLVGRIRPDPGSPPGRVGRRWCLLLSGDQIRKGAALNAVQILARLGHLPRPVCAAVPAAVA